MIQSPLLTPFDGILHGFGTKGSEAPQNLFLIKQVHGNKIFTDQPVPGSHPNGFDGIVTSERGIAIGIATADCLPILLYEPKAGIIAAVHAGWRGTEARVVQKAIAEMVERGGETARIVAALGPEIQGSCYEVGPEVALLFEKEFPNAIRPHPKKREKWLLDLPAANREQLVASGLRPEKIDTIDLCTHCRPDLFHSYRRDGPACGRMVSWIRRIT